MIFLRGSIGSSTAKETIRLYSKDYEIRAVNNLVIEEDDDNLRFKEDVQEWLGIEIETAINPKFPNCSDREVW